MKQKVNSKTYVMIGLLVLVLIMAVGFAAFATTLTVNGTSTISSSWCVGFYNQNTDAKQITKGLQTGTTPTGSITFSGTACSTNYVPTATLGATFYQPGDKIEYTLTIANKGSLAAAIESITVDNQSVTSDQEIKKGNIIWKVYMPEQTTLAATTGTTTMIVSAEFQNDTNITSYTTSESQSIAVGINAVQSTGSNAMTIAESTTFVYAWHSQKKCYNDACISSQGFSNTITDGVADYTQLSSYQSGKTYFLKYEINGSNEIQNVWVCQKFTFIDNPVCLQGGDSSFYGTSTTGNVGILTNLSSTFSSNGGSCSTDSFGMSCSADSLSIFTQKDGRAYSNGVRAYEQCSILSPTSYGYARCNG